MPTPVHKVQAEIAGLAQTYGEPVIINQTLRIKWLFGAIEERPARVAEVVPVVQRPNGKVLTMLKTSYPPGAHRLPSGGIHKGEPILDALLRESYEETGMVVTVRRFLAIIRYQIIAATGRTGRFTSYAFLVDGVGPIQPMDPNEHIAEFREVELSDLRAMGDFLYNLRTADENDWNDWGRFRSVVHRVVADILVPQAVP
jgi:8-oxo-dGTP pyrophosphatase MutT (NUDIX family)